ncbi:MAG TPA: UbiA family prenyltransferase [Planctomycetota bacterium]|nr:UbiA family prenyltransferase [Planctomycetota bacterium]
MIAYLKLVRLPNVFTAISNIVVGGVIATAVTGSLTWKTALLALSSAALYMSGMAFNDFADREEDAKFRPGRPIPSGKVSPAGAFLCGAMLMLLGLACAFAVSLSSLYCAVSLAIVILLYDFGTAGIPVLGALTLGGCRFFNVLLGLTAGLDWISARVFSTDPLQVPLAPAIIMGLYASGVTAFSAQEEEGRDRKAGWIGWIFVDAALLVAFFATTGSFAIPILALIWTMIFYHSYRVRTQGTPEAARNMIRTAVMAMPVLDAALIIGFAGTEKFLWALVCISLLIPGMIVGKWLAQKEA